MLRLLSCLSVPPLMKAQIPITILSIALFLGSCAIEEPHALPEVTTVDFGSGPSEVHYQVEDGLAIMEGDIILGRADEVTDGVSYNFSDTDGPVAAGAFAHSSKWPEGIIRYKLDPGISDLHDMIEDAIDEWNATGFIQIIPDDGQGVAGHHVYFTGNPLSTQAGASAIGYSPPWGFPKWQEIRLGGSSPIGTARHEIGHAIGLLHEQSRTDRDDHVEVFMNNVEWPLGYNFDKHGLEATTYRSYNTDSLMHYSERSFAKDREYPTILKKGCNYEKLVDVPENCRIRGSRTIADSDRLTVVRMYAGPPTQLKNDNSDRCLRVSGASTTSGAQIVTATCSASSRSRRWYRFYRKNRFGGSSGYFLVNQNSLMCLTIENDDVVQRPCLGGGNQIFETPSSSGGIKIRKAGSDRCVRHTGSSSNVFLSNSCPASKSRRWFRI